MNSYAVIIGYGPGVGHAVAEAFAKRGYALALLARDAAKLDGAVGRFEGEGIAARGFPVDVGDLAAFDRALAGVREALGEPDVLVYNAARWTPGPVLATDPADFERDLRLDVTGALVAARWAGPSMVARGRGTILFTGGGFALYPSPGAPSLSIGKSGIRALALMLAAELAPARVRVGTVTIAGTVAANSAFSPDAIAGEFLRLHETSADATTAEIVFRGNAGATASKPSTISSRSCVRAAKTIRSAMRRGSA